MGLLCSVTLNQKQVCTALSSIHSPISEHLRIVASFHMISHTQSSTMFAFVIGIMRYQP